MFDVAIDSRLRGCDTVKLENDDLVSGGRVRSWAIVIQRKTGRPMLFELHEPARTRILPWLAARGGTFDDYAFPSRLDGVTHLSTRQYARLVDGWGRGIGQRSEDHGTHSLRRTKASLIDKRTGNLRAVQIRLGPTKIESTVMYLGVDVEGASKPTRQQRAHGGRGRGIPARPEADGNRERPVGHVSFVTGVEPGLRRGESIERSWRAD